MPKQHFCLSMWETIPVPNVYLFIRLDKITSAQHPLTHLLWGFRPCNMVFISTLSLPATSHLCWLKTRTKEVWKSSFITAEQTQPADEEHGICSKAPEQVTRPWVATVFANVKNELWSSNIFCMVLQILMFNC